jgi:biotin/methionine sulfoxide reductase
MDWIRHLYGLSRNDALTRFHFEMPDFEQFWALGAAEIPTSDDFTCLADFRADPEEHVLATESGKIVLGSTLLAAKDYADCRAHPAWLPPEEWLDAKAERSGAFHLLSPQPDGRLHAQLVHAGPSLDRMPDGRERMRIHPVDADRLGIRAGEIARVWNARGSCLAVADPYDGIRPGVIALPTGGWLTPGGDAEAPELSGNPNVLTLDIPSSSLGQGCAAQTCLVRVERWQGNVAEAAAAYDATLAGALEG